jgi:hypothetical protein
MTLPGDVQIPSGTDQIPQGSGQPDPIPQQNTPAPLFSNEQVTAMQEMIRELSRPVAQEVATNAFRGFQSITQKLENRVAAKFTELETLGFSLTPEQKNAIRETAKQELANEPENATSQVAPNQTQPQQTDNLVTAAQQLIQELGVQLENNDPEIKMVVDDPNQPLKFLRTFEQALTAKKARLVKQQAINDPKNVPSAGQRGAPGNPIANVNDMDTLYEMARSKK